MRIAIIDNGVNPELVDCFEEVVFCNDGCLDNGDREKYGHGTICAAIVKKYVPQAEIVSLKVMGSLAKRCHLLHVQEAINYCIEQHIRLVSMSIGTRNMVEIALLHNIVAKAIEAGIVIVAPGSRDLIVYPAAFPGVVYVDINETCINRDEKYYIERCSNGLMAFIASGAQDITFTTGDIFTTPNYSSFSVPVITAQLHEIMENETDIKSINELLKNGALGYLHSAHNAPSSRC